MDKYEFNIKLEQIKKLAAKKEYKQAADIAKEMNWNKVKDWTTLATIINVQEAAGDYEEARDMAILAYNRNLGGRKLVYKLTEFFIKVNDFENAEELYNEYAKVSAHDANRFILYYDLKKAQGAPDTELVDILEEYKEAEIDEKYMYELAELYYKTGRKEDCTKTCDNLVLWFQDGIYVEKAVKLKEKLGVNLSNTQKKILDEINARKTDEEANKERMFMEQKELARLKKDEVGDILDADDKAHNTAKESGKTADKAGKTVTDYKDAVNPEKVNSEKVNSEKGNNASGVSIDLVQNDQNNALKDSIVRAIERQNEARKEAANVLSGNKSAVSGSMSDNISDAAKTVQDNTSSAENTKENEDALSKSTLSEGILSDSKSSDSVSSDSVSSDSVTSGKTADVTTTDDSFAENINKASLSLKELIENAKKKIESNCEQISREDEEEARIAAKKRIDEQADAMDIEVKVPNYSMYDTHNLQEELAQNVQSLFEDEQEDTFRPPFERKVSDTKSINNISTNNKTLEQSQMLQSGYDESAVNPDDEQIEGQLSITDWMESVREEKYGKQDTREFSKAELERMLDEKDEKSEAYERIIAKKKEEALNKGAEFNETEAKRIAAAEVAVESAKRDLAMRTGRAVFILEQKTAHELKKAESEVNTVIHDKADVNESNINELNVNESSVNTQNVNESNAAGVSEEMTLDTAQFTPVTDEMIKAYEQNSDNRPDEDMSRQQLETAASIVSDTSTDSASVTDYADDMNNNDNQADDMEEEQTEKKLTGELAKIFRKYREMPGIEEQLVDLFEALDEEMNMSTSATGNILISGNSSSDKTDLARTIVRAINYVYPDKPKKIAKTSGESINQRGIVKAMGKLKGTALIVEGAGTIQPRRINEILECMQEDTERMIVIFEDSDAEMNVLLNFNPELTKTFNHKITLKQYNVNELVEMAKRFARKRQYEVDDNALLELYLKIDKLHNMNDNLKLDDIKEVINKAIANSERRASRRFFGGLKKKRSDNGDVIFLTEADFKD